MKSEILLPHLFEAAYIVDENRKILYWNKKCEEITGYKSEEVVGQHCYDNILRHVTESGEQYCHGRCPLLNCIRNDKINYAKLFLHHKEGYRIPVTIKTIPFIDEVDKSLKAIEIFTDMQEQEDLYEENKSLNKAIITDNLTEIYNRSFIDYQLEVCIKEFNTFKTPLALLFMDIDHFKQVNDNYGHDVGDMVLKAVAKTISMSTRKNDFVGRFGGEEFVVILRNLSESEMLFVAEKIRALVAGTSIETIDDSISVTISIGCVYYREGLSKEAFIKEADKLMYLAKTSGRNKVMSN